MTRSDWAIAKLDENPGSFLTLFCKAYLHADAQNQAILESAADALMEKYPVRLAAIKLADEGYPGDSKNS